MQVTDLLRYKQQHQKLACLTAYDCRTAQLLEQSGIDVILVGDSLANTCLGMEQTMELDLPAMLHHLKAVKRGISKALLVADLPFGSYQSSCAQACDSAVALVRAGAQAVKLEGATPHILTVITHLCSHGIPVIAHLGYTPQSALVLGQGRKQGTQPAQAEQILDDAIAVAQAGASAIVLELIPHDLAAQITIQLSIPTIGIGSGPHCDGQILVTDDLLGRFEHQYKFVKRYANLTEILSEAFTSFAQETRSGIFPAPEPFQNPS